MKLDDILKIKKVKFVSASNSHMTNGKYYTLLGVTDRSCIINDDNEREAWVNMSYFEAPPKELMGSDLARDLIKKGWKGFTCVCGNSGDDNVMITTIVTGTNNSGQFVDFKGRFFNNAIPMLGSYPLTQPTDAGERPLTLIEKLEQLSDKYLNQYKYYGDNAYLNCSSAVDEAINIVKQHQAESEVQDETA